MINLKAKIVKLFLVPVLCMCSYNGESAYNLRIRNLPISNEARTLRQSGMTLVKERSAYWCSVNNKLLEYFGGAQVRIIDKNLGVQEFSVSGSLKVDLSQYIDDKPYSFIISILKEALIFPQNDPDLCYLQDGMKHRIYITIVPNTLIDGYLYGYQQDGYANICYPIKTIGNQKTQKVVYKVTPYAEETSVKGEVEEVRSCALIDANTYSDFEADYQKASKNGYYIINARASFQCDSWLIRDSA